MNLSPVWLAKTGVSLCRNPKKNVAADWFIFILMKTKHIVHIKIFGVVTGDIDVIPPFIFLHGLRLKTEADTKYLEKVVLF